MILYIYGDDTYRSRAYLGELVAQFKRQRDPAGYNVKMLDGKDVSTETLFAELLSAPFLAEKRFVAVENLLSSSDKELLASFKERLTGKPLPDSTVVVVWQGEPLSKVKEAKELHALLAKEKFAKEFERLAGAKLQNYIEKEIEKLGSAIDKPASAAVADVASADSWQLHFLINQLGSLRHGSTVSLADVREFVEEKIDDNVFAMVEALASGNREYCFKLLAEQRRQGEDDMKLIGLIVWQFRILLSLSHLLEQETKITSDEAASRLKLHPFVAKKNIALVRRYTLGKLEALYRELLDIDYKFKTGQADADLLVDLFTAKV